MGIRGTTFTAIAAGAIGMILPTSNAMASSAGATSRSRIVKPVSIANTRDLDFGIVVRGTTAGTVTINAQSGARTKTGGVLLQGTTGFSSAAFTGAGTGGRLVRLTIGTPTITLNRVGGGTMTVNAFRISNNGAAPQTLPRNYTLPASGIDDISIGARLNVAANQAEGLYTGSFTISMDYQ
jgi:Domain of unknown function (DUF4402)